MSEYPTEEAYLAVCHANDQKRIQIQSMQSRIDELMWEYCPEDMTAAQIHEWSSNQAPAPETVTEVDFQELRQANSHALA